MIIYYENYAHNLNKTKDDLLQFLLQEEVNDPPNFVTGKISIMRRINEKVCTVLIVAGTAHSTLPCHVWRANYWQLKKSARNVL